MTTRERAARIAHAAGDFPFLGPITASALLDLVTLELGHEEILDGFRPYGTHLTRAIAPPTVLHVLSGNLPHAGLQSLVRGLLLGSRNLCKLPSRGLPEIERFAASLGPELSTLVEFRQTLPDEWLMAADAVIVFGADETIELLRGKARPDATFVGHGHKVSLGMIFDDPAFESVEGAALDVSLFDQQGCLSPHLFYVRESAALTAEKYAARLAEAMERGLAAMPQGERTVSEHAAIREVRGEYSFREANGEPVKIWQSSSSTEWTVICERSPEFVQSVLNRVIYVKPLPTDPAAGLALVRDWLSAISIWPVTPENAALAAAAGASRICPVGRMQTPSITWHQDGGQTLAPLVRWIDFERQPA